MAAGVHFDFFLKVVFSSEMARNAIESDFRSSKMAQIRLKIKLRIDLKWREIDSKMIFGHPKWPPAAILWNLKNKVVYWSEMARNAIESDFRSSKMATGSHFVKKTGAYWSEMARNAIKGDFRSSNIAAGKNKSCVLIWNGEKCDKRLFSVIQYGRRQPFCEQKIKIKVAYCSEMERNAIESDFWSSNMAAAAILWKNNQSCALIWNGEKSDRKWF